MEMHTVAPHHVVPVAGIDEEVGMRPLVDAGFQEGVGHLGDTDGIVAAMDDEQAALQVAGLLQEAAVLISLGVALGGVHVALAVHHFVVFPIGDGATGHTHLEHVGIGEHQVGGHESAITPAVYTETVNVHVGQTLEEIDSLQLVFHLLHAQLAEGAVLERQATVAASAIINGEHHVTLLGHVDVPSAHVVVPRVVNHLRMGAAIDVDDGGIGLRRVEIDGLHQAVVEVGHPIGGFQGAYAYLRGIEALPRIGGIEQRMSNFSRFHRHQFDAARSGGGGIAVDHPVGRGGELHGVYALTVA